jgi:hypothetical protein
VLQQQNPERYMVPIKTMSARAAKIKIPIAMARTISAQLRRGVRVTHGIEVPRVFLLARIIAPLDHA